MSTYAIGDLQGCYTELQDLLNRINFDAAKDRLWFVGDLINRGPASLACLQFVKSLGDAASVVSGNHDLYLLAVANRIYKPHKKDTLDEILNADAASELLEWIRSRPLLVHDADLNFTMVHAGIHPQWSLTEALELAQETESLLRGDQFKQFLPSMFGDSPDQWHDAITGYDRHRFIINCFTRMRYCEADGRLNLKEKKAPSTQNKNLIPWYSLPARKTRQNKVIFGHWSTLAAGSHNNTEQYNVFPLDTGCLWGGALTAMRLEDGQYFQVPSQQAPRVQPDTAQPSRVQLDSA